MSSPTKILREVLEAHGDIEWARCVGGDDPLRPPFIAWRYQRPDARLEKRIVDAVNGYRGRVVWAIRKGERNWVIEPAAFRSYAKDFRVDVEAMIGFGETFPMETRSALDEVSMLAEHLKRELVRSLG